MNDFREQLPWVLIGFLLGVIVTSAGFGVWYFRPFSGDGDAMIEEPMPPGAEFESEAYGEPDVQADEEAGDAGCDPEPVLAQIDEEIARDYQTQGPKELLGAAMEIERTADIISSGWVKGALLYRRVEEISKDPGDLQRAREGLFRLHARMTETQLAAPDDECKVDRAAHEYLTRYGMVQHE